MKMITTLCAAAVLAAPLAVSAQENNPSSTSGERPNKPHHRFWHPGAGLSTEEAQKLAAARDKAKEDPTVRSLEDAKRKIDQQLQDAMRAAILAADPGLAPTLDKVKESRDRAKGMRQRFESLTPENKQALKTARRAAMDDPAVQAAREKMKAATTPEAKMQAGRQMHEAMRAAMLEQNPDLAPVLEKLGKNGGPKGPRPMPEGAPSENSPAEE